MALDFPRAWQLARAAAITDHSPQCSFVVSDGGVLCDCHVLYQHQEYLDKFHLYSAEGVIYYTYNEQGNIVKDTPHG